MAGPGRQSCYFPSSGSRNLAPPPGLGFPDIKSRPWVTPEQDECQFKCCPNCRPLSAQRSYLSLDAVMSGDNAQNEPRSDATPTARRRQARSSSRPRGPPSVSTPGMHSDIDGFADDEIVGRRGMRRQAAGNQDIPRVVDTTAETLGIQFERFLDKYRSTSAKMRIRTDWRAASQKNLRRRRQRRAQSPPTNTTLPRFMACASSSSRPSTSTLPI